MSNALQPRNNGGSITPQEWPVMREQAQMLIKTGFLPSAVNTPEKALAIMMKGREIGIPPMYALSNIAVIQGKPTCGAELMLALIYRDHGDDAIAFEEATDQRCTISYKRRNASERKTYTFSIEQARQARLAGDNWQKYPAAMLRARCISSVARMAFPDSIGGMYTPDEMGAVVNEEGEAISLAVPENHVMRGSSDPKAFLPAAHPIHEDSTGEELKALRADVKELAAQVFTGTTARADFLAFLDEFGVTAIKELTEEQCREAKATLEEVLGRPQEVEEADFTADPEEEDGEEYIPTEGPYAEVSDAELFSVLGGELPDAEETEESPDVRAFKGGR